MKKCFTLLSLLEIGFLKCLFSPNEDFFIALDTEVNENLCLYHIMYILDFVK